MATVAFTRVDNLGVDCGKLYGTDPFLLDRNRQRGRHGLCRPVVIEDVRRADRARRLMIYNQVSLLILA